MPSNQKACPMPTLKLHYDGWIALPAGIRQLLGLNSGDRLMAELADGALVLRPAAKKASVAATKSIRAAVPIEPEQGMLWLIDEPGAPKKTRRAAKGTDESAAAPKRRGRPPKTVAGIAPPRVQANPIVGIGPAKLIKKAELAAVSVPPEAPPAPAVRIRPERISQPVERRPFRNVEVRTLGPGRGHNRPNRMPSGSVV